MSKSVIVKKLIINLKIRAHHAEKTMDINGQRRDNDTVKYTHKRTRVEKYS